MRFKTLKHKTLPDTYGVIDTSPEGMEIMHGTIPSLVSLATTMELFREYWERQGFKTVVKQLEDYELVEIAVYEAGKVKIPVEYLTYKDGTKEFYAQLKHWQSLSIGKDRNTIFSMLREKLEELIPSIKERI